MAKALSKDEQIDHILEQLGEENRTLSAVCREDEGMPKLSTFLGWVAKDQTLADRYSCAREAQVTASLEQIIAISDDVTDDAVIVEHNGRTFAKVNGKTARRAEVMIAAREKFAKLMLPERFAQQRMDVTTGGKALPAPIQHNDNRIVALLQLAASRIPELKAVGGQTIDVTPLSLDELMS